MNTQSKIEKGAELENLKSLENAEEFLGRHIGPDDAEVGEMLGELGLDSLDALVSSTVPANILLKEDLKLGSAMTENMALSELKTMMADDALGRSYIGLGYYDTYTPTVILRNVLENPGWYTSYTPYQPEISQGRLECLLNFQQMVMDLTGMEIANASLLDEATAAAEGMALAKRVCKKKQCKLFFVDKNCFPQTIDLIKTRASGSGYEIVIDDAANIENHDVFGAMFQYPNIEGSPEDLGITIDKLHKQQGIAVVAADIMSLVLLKAPGEMGADVVVGTTQRFGVPMGYGGPHAAYFATRDEYKRSIPGRMIGVSIDARGKPAYRMALQTREQHIRREKANSNICTAQALLANISALYAMYHGPVGLKRIASRIHRLTAILATALNKHGIKTVNDSFFDTLTISLSDKALGDVKNRADTAGINLFMGNAAKGSVGISLDECCSLKDVSTLIRVILGEDASKLDLDALDSEITALGGSAFIPENLKRNSAFLEHPIFNILQSETEMLRYLKRMENKDLSLTHSMIPLGSCTMKLNATSEMIPISWPELNSVHPFVPVEKVPGYQKMIAGLESMLEEILGFDGISSQPNSGAQGEYAGLFAIRGYLDSKGQQARNVCLIPSSAHGTNPASAQMVGMKVVIVACDELGNIDLEDLKAKAAENADELAALMITYPSTHGVFEEAVKEICQTIHDFGGQVYMDGANLNAQVGVTRPGDIGADVSHVNLHKTFCIPHGGGGPGMGPIGVKAHLIPFLANHSVIKLEAPMADNSAVSAAPWGSASILPISWMYMKMMGWQGLKKATEVAMLNANYIARKLEPHYPILYTGKNGLVAHECIIDLRPLKAASGISEEDVAKRLMDFGFHAPTMSFPVAGTLMIEPTESESKMELDRFIDAMILIRQEIAAVESGEIDPANNPLKHAPHTLRDIVFEEWDRPYSKEQGAFPAPWLIEAKYWPTVNRVDNVYGDRNLICSCPPLEDYI